MTKFCNLFVIDSWNCTKFTKNDSKVCFLKKISGYSWTCSEIQKFMILQEIKQKSSFQALSEVLSCNRAEFHNLNSTHTWTNFLANFQRLCTSFIPQLQLWTFDFVSCKFYLNYCLFGITLVELCIKVKYSSDDTFPVHFKLMKSDKFTRNLRNLQPHSSRSFSLLTLIAVEPTIALSRHTCCLYTSNPRIQVFCSERVAHLQRRGKSMSVYPPLSILIATSLASGFGQLTSGNFAELRRLVLFWVCNFFSVETFAR